MQKRWLVNLKDEIVLTGIVLYTTQTNEYDKRLVVLTSERGKVTIFANGARRPNSPYRAASQSFVMGKFTVLEGRDSYRLIKVDVSEYFSEISLDMQKLCYASYFCEFMSYYTREGDSCNNNLNLLYVTLKSLVQDNMDLQLIRYVYEIKLMDIEGQGIHAYSCVKCNKKDNLLFISSVAGGLICEKCVGIAKKVKKISPTAIYTIQYVLSAPLTKLYSFRLDKKALEELSQIVDDFRNEYVEKNFKSMEILESLA